MTPAQRAKIKANALGLVQSNHSFGTPEYLLANIMALTARVSALEAEAGLHDEDALAGLLGPVAPLQTPPDQAEAEKRAAADAAAAQAKAAAAAAAQAAADKAAAAVAATAPL